jgi:hypothetical protein
VELGLLPTSGRFDVHDNRWALQIVDLLTGLRRSGVNIRVEGDPAPGQKGSIETIVVALGSAGAFQAMIHILKLWLERDDSRALRVTWDDDGRKHSIVLSATGDQRGYQLLADLALRIAGRDDL